MTSFSNQANGFRSFLKISTEGDKTHSASLKSRIDAFSFNTKSLELTLKDIALTNSSIKFENLSNLKNNWGQSNLSVGKVRFDGKMQGHLPRFNVISKSSGELTEGMFFSDSNRTRMALNYWYNSVLTLEGEAQFIPKNFDLYYDTKKGRLKVLDGDEIHAHLFRNEMANKATTPMFFKARTDRLSTFETPYGAFVLSGRIAPDYSIFVDSAWGKFGRSEVTGTYSQSWHPHNFRFLLKGECFPTDINNWLGKWWKSIWDDFVFTDETPHGDFSISGNWQKPNESTITSGTVKTGSFSFRGLSIDDSNLMIYADGNITQIKASADHDKGHLDGNLTIPRNLGSADNPLSFQLKGDFPLNEGRKVFGQEVEEILSDFNSSVASCEADGNLYLSKDNSSGESNKTHYKINVFTDANASLWNIPVSRINGKLTHHNSTTWGQDITIGIAEGMGRLEFEAKNGPNDDILDFNFTLNNAKPTALAVALSNFSGLDSSDRNFIKQTKEDSEDSSERIDFSIQARGQPDKPLGFNGSGNITLSGKTLRHIPLLGGIAKVLETIVSIPILSDSFSFNKLEVPFQLGNDKMSSDKIFLTGPLAKLEFKGHLNLITREVDFTSNVKLIDNLKIPLLSPILDSAARIPLAPKLGLITISGNWKDPKIEYKLFK